MAKGKRKKAVTVSVSVLVVLAITVATLLGLWYGTDILQKSLIRFMCKDEPSSTPRNYEEILNSTTLTSCEYAEGLTLDVIEPAGLGEDALCVLLFHGGYYVGGGRHNQEPFARLIASRGFRVFNIDYSKVPENVYPAQLTEANAALSYAAAAYPESKGYVVAGDSAGAHLAAQLCALVRSGGFPARPGIEPAVEAERLVGFVGSCGFYQASTVADTGFFMIESAMRMLTGERNYKESAAIAELDLHNYAAYFPDVLLLCGDKDDFLAENTAFRDVLATEGVRVETYFPISGAKPLGHEFQCNYDLEESYEAAEKIVGFLNALG